MANDKTYDRHVNIWINGKEVKNDISSIKKEMFNLTNELSRATRGTKEYNEKAAELGKVKGILKEHQENIKATGSLWDKLGNAVPASVSKMASAFKALLANPVVLIITLVVTAVTALIKAFKSTDSGAVAFAARMEQVKAILDVLRQRLISVTDAIGHVFKGEWKEAATSMKEAFTGIADQIKSATSAAYEYQIALDKVQDAESNYTSQAAENRNKIAKLEYTAQDRSKSTEERRKALQEALAIGREEVKTAQDFAKQKLDNEMNYLAGKAGLRGEDVLGFIKMTDAEQINASGSLKTLRNNNEEKFAEIEKLYAAWIDADTKFYEENKRNIGRMTAFEEEERKKDLDLKEQMERYTDEYFDKEQKRQQKDLALKEQMERYTDEYFDKEQKRQQEDLALKEQMERYTDEYFDKEQLRKDKQLQADQKLMDQKRELFQNLAGFESTLFDRQFAKLESQYKTESSLAKKKYEGEILAAGNNAELKKKIENGYNKSREKADEEYNKKRNALAKKAAIADKIAALFSIGIDTAKGVANAASKIITLPLIPWIIANGVIQAAIVAAKPVPEFAIGGYTGSGGKYEPAGVVHRGEYVVNADTVANPAFTPMLQAMEYARLNGMQGYANGGMATGGGQQATGGTAAALLSSNPRLESSIDRLNRFLDSLERNGVKNNWPWQDVDNMRKGMTKLEDIEGSVTM